MIQLIRRFFDDIHLIAEVLKYGGVAVSLSPEDRSLLANYRRRRPSVKKEAAREKEVSL